jgi:hypothetical protein
MEIRKAHWTTDGDNYRMDMPLTKVDKENRLVSGWASLDNPDLQGDVVLAEASQKAFSKFRGNIREMHQPIAVGRMVSYRPETYYGEDGTKYNGIFVTAYVSKGAQDTWEKVLDGTLSAFSIKGPIRDSEVDVTKSVNGRPLRIVKDYDLEELSLVDSGGNQLANVVSIHKSVDGNVEVTGMIADTHLENVFWCEKDRVAKISADESATCPEGHKMVNTGWEEFDGSNDVQKMQTVLKNYLEKGKPAQAEESANNEGGVDVADTKNEEAVAGVAAPAEVEAGEQGKPQNEVEASVESAADVEEVAAGDEKVEAADVSEVDADSDLEKSLSDLEAKIADGVEKNATAIEALAKTIDEKLSEREDAISKKFEELAEKQADLTKSIESVVEGLEKMTKSVSGLEKETALKKSGDLGGSQEDGTLEKSSGVWAGAFL